MCGITGYWHRAPTQNADAMKITVEKMAKTLLHRGPDHGGTWVEPEVGIALGHRRLAILDLSPEGNQPMVSQNSRYIIVFNGEIYNFLELKKDLEQLGYRFRGHSDTEVMLASFEQWGLEAAVKRFVGMFAFALWDRKERVLHLGRDRVGEKPLYYGWMKGTFLFSSELKALKVHPYWEGEIDRHALTLLMRHSYINAPHSIYQNIYKLPPGTLLTIQEPLSRPTPQAYWSAKSIVELGASNPFTGNEKEAVEALDLLLKNTIKQQMIADVPLGAFLSGGIDSSTVVALMQTQSSQPVKTFTIGFHETGYNEANEAKAVAQHLGTEHTELYVTPQEAIAVIPQLPTLYDEPFADSSQIPTFLVAQLAKQQVTVSLSGDGGDELFGGYNRYFWAQGLWQKFGLLPQKGRQIIANMITKRSPHAWDELFHQLAPFLPKSLQQRLPGDKLHKLAAILTVTTPEALYQNLVSHWQEPSELVIGATEPETPLTKAASWINLPNFSQKMMYLDSITYLPGDILTKIDRAAMGISLETRIPFLNHLVVEFANTLPLNFKIRQGQGKWLLRQVLYQYVPPNLIERPKMGFGIPLDHWLRHELRDWGEALLDENYLHQEGFFNPQAIRQKWQEHLSGTRNWQEHLWSVLMFQMWRQQES